MEEIYLAGGCLWGVQEFLRHLPGVFQTEAGRANGTQLDTQEGDYDGYVECVKTVFDSNLVTVGELMAYLFEIIDPYSLNQQGNDVGEKYRTGVYSLNSNHLKQASDWIAQRPDSAKILVEVRPLTHYLRSDEAHQNRLTRCPDENCHLPKELLHKYKK
tara:strand:+ start:1038 stop:1514 length:477 start_codon:yes stop_codon:yes gene_type:complete